MEMVISLILKIESITGQKMGQNIETSPLLDKTLHLTAFNVIFYINTGTFKFHLQSININFSGTSSMGSSFDWFLSFKFIN